MSGTMMKGARMPMKRRSEIGRADTLLTEPLAGPGNGSKTMNRSTPRNPFPQREPRAKQPLTWRFTDWAAI